MVYEKQILEFGIWIGIFLTCFLIVWIEDLWNFKVATSMKHFLVERNMLNSYENWRKFKNGNKFFKRW